MTLLKMRRGLLRVVKGQNQFNLKLWINQIYIQISSSDAVLEKFATDIIPKFCWNSAKILQ